MLLPEFYTFQILNADGNQVQASVMLNKNHDVYKGHFPQIPITPGVCQVLIIKELLSHVLGKSLQMLKSRDIKFLSMHNPTNEEALDVTINYQTTSDSIISVNALISSNVTKILKFNGEFKSI
jgi:3-hydroxyacyl-[acyl-carrier-protein] dehydratase